VLLKYILNGCDYRKRLKVENLKSYDVQIYNSIKYLAEVSTLDLNTNPFFFTIMSETGQEIDLVKNGKEIQVT